MNLKNLNNSHPKPKTQKIQDIIYLKPSQLKTQCIQCTGNPIKLLNDLKPKIT
uniref:Uncharacterized protein n=1 Tax=Rhizophora mucronata TaxID=61149 RepID=A0A2P2PDW2_RHIMU